MVIRALLLFGFVAGSLVAEKGFAFNEIEKKRLIESERSWSAKKLEYGGDYRYESRFQSWTGYRSETIQYVSNDIVYRRIYNAYHPGAPVPDGFPDLYRAYGPVYSYDEGYSALGTNQSGASVSTVDQLYQSCEELLERRDPTRNRITLEFSDEGLLSVCTYTPKNCADDCSEGIRIQDVAFEPVPGSVAREPDPEQGSERDD